MLNQRLKNSTAFVFLFAFMLIKVVGLHSLTHQDNVDEATDCVWCHLSGVDQNTPVIASKANFELAPIHFHKEREVINHYTSVNSSKKPVCLIFNKPPPSLAV